MEKVKEAKGCIIDENERDGRRYIGGDNAKQKKNGGARYKRSQEEYLQIVTKSRAQLHDDALSILDNNVTVEVS